MSTKWTFVHVASCSGSHMSYMSPSLIPHDIILADIGAVLYLDDLERDAAGVFELGVTSAVPRPYLYDSFDFFSKKSSKMR